MEISTHSEEVIEKLESEESKVEDFEFDACNAPILDYLLPMLEEHCR